MARLNSRDGVGRKKVQEESVLSPLKLQMKPIMNLYVSVMRIYCQYKLKEFFLAINLDKLSEY